MKNLHMLICTAITINIVVASGVNGQVANKDYFVSNDKIKEYLIFEETLKSSEVKVPVKNVSAPKAALKAFKANTKAGENFKKYFKNAEGVTWLVRNDAIIGSFVKNNIATYVNYNNRGVWNNTLVYYTNEEEMPDVVPSLIKKLYKGYKVSLCVEIFENGLQFYIVQIEDEHTCKQLGVYYGEVNIISQFNKQH